MRALAIAPLCALLALGPVGCASLLAPLVQPAVSAAMDKAGQGAQELGHSTKTAGSERRARGGAWNKLLGTAQEFAGELLIGLGTIAAGGAIVKKRGKKKKRIERRERRELQVAREDSIRREAAAFALAKKPDDLRREPGPAQPRRGGVL